MDEPGSPALLFDNSNMTAGELRLGVHTSQQEGPPLVTLRAKRALSNGDPMSILLLVLAGPWTLLVAWKLSTEGPKRFSELRRGIAGISSKVLVDRLSLLEHEQLVARNVEDSVPPGVTYHATQRLQELAPILRSLSELAKKWYADEAAHANGKAGAAAEEVVTS